MRSRGGKGEEGDKGREKVEGGKIINLRQVWTTLNTSFS